MKKLFFLPLTFFLFAIGYHSDAQILKKVANKLKNKSEEKTEQAAEQEAKKDTIKDPSVAETNNNSNSQDPAANEPAPAPLKVYANYDFVPGTKILFEDNFADDQDGEFPMHWELKAGQAVLNKINGEEALYFTDGNYARLIPRIKTEKYLTDSFTIEYDYYYVPGAYGSLLLLKGYDKELGFERESNLQVGNAYANFTGTTGGVELSKDYSEDLKTNFENKWHHVAIAVKNHQLKVYVDQFRVLVVPDTKESYSNLVFAGIGSESEPIVIKNIRIAQGAGMNMLGKKFTEAKIVTHGINFDVNKATIRPESMGTLNMVVQILKDNPDIKFEIGGHTDADGTDAYNLKLSQQRAEAVKDQLIKMGIDPSRLTSKGYGESKPISDNTSPEGKANNRRVEFVKQ